MYMASVCISNASLQISFVLTAIKKSTILLYFLVFSDGYISEDIFKLGPEERFKDPGQWAI